MVFYYESYPAVLTTPTSRHHQFGAVGHHYPYGQTQAQYPQEMPCAMSQFGSPMDSSVQLQTPWSAQNSFSTSSCSRTPGYDDWSTKSPCANLSTGPGCGSPGYNAGYKLGGSQDFSQQPGHGLPAQDLSVHGGGQQSPDSGLTVSSDGVSSSDSLGSANVLTGMQQHATGSMQQGLRPPIIRSPYDWIKKPSYQTQCNPGKTRTKDKYRVVYSDIQRLELEKEFHYSRYITIRRKAELAQLLGLSERQVKIWFQNRRAKERKQVKKRDELVQKEKDIVVHHHLQPLQISTANEIGNKMINLD